jgi:flagellar motility protein MotE (MotC chaperone)
MGSLSRRAFVATESRIMTVFTLLRQIVDGTSLDAEARVAELLRRRAEIDDELARVRAGELTIMDAARVKDRFIQMSETARGLLSDFREVEQNFRELDRAVREKIATWEHGKGALLTEIFGERDAISDSDQGKTFRAFWTG